jgi:hypothetical protein
VCWNADRTQILRDASAVAPGAHVHVTLQRGELDAQVEAATHEAAKMSRDEHDS